MKISRAVLLVFQSHAALNSVVYRQIGLRTDRASLKTMLLWCCHSQRFLAACVQERLQEHRQLEIKKAEEAKQKDGLRTSLQAALQVLPFRNLLWYLAPP